MTPIVPTGAETRATPTSVLRSWAGEWTRRLAALGFLLASGISSAQTTSSTSLLASPNPAQHNQTVTLKAQVTGALPSGTVTFMDGATVLHKQALSAGVTSVSRVFAPGSHSLTAVYSGNAANTPSTSAAVVLVVSPPVTTTTVKSSANPSAYGTRIQLSASVRATRTLIGGTVTFYDEGAALSTAYLLIHGKTGSASITAPLLSAGRHTITASFSGDDVNPASTSTALVQQVTLAATNTKLGVSPTTSAFGPAVMLTATVSGSGTARTGAVTFYDGSVVLGTGSLDASSVGTLPVKLGAGPHSLKAAYTGDSNSQPSTSSIVSATVSKASTSTSLSAQPNSSRFGDAVTLSATVAGPAPTGSVTFKDGTVTLGSAPVAGGAATLTVSSLTVGGHTLSATYGGDANQSSSSSAPVTQKVSQAATTTTLASSINPGAPGQAIVLTASVTGLSPTGSVTFRDGTVVLGSTSLSGTGSTRTASLPVASLAAGNHSLTAQYTGDTSNAGSTSATLMQLVQTPSATTLTSGINPANFGQSVALLATVTGYQPSGSVTFTDGATVLGTAPLVAAGTNSATATLNAPALAVGSHSLLAAYPGDNLNTASRSITLTQTIRQAPTSTSLASSQNPAIYGQGITWTVTVSGGVSATGSVILKDGATVLGTAPLAGNSASFTSTALAAGSHAITATYSGDTNNATSTSGTLAQTLSQASGTTALSSSANPGTYGQSLTFLATVGGFNPTGSVTFKDAGTTLATVAIAAGQASYSTGALAVGSHSITASYSGDANNAATTSTALVQTVTAAPTTTTITASPNSASFGQSVSLTATVAGANPTGTVDFKGGMTTIGSAALTNGMATLASSSLAVGNRVITAAYGGDGNNAPSTSSPLTEVVGQASASVSLASSANPAAVGQAVTFSAQVSGPNATGAVTFKDGADTLTTVPLTAGAASFTTNALTSGSHSITASYGGDTNNSAATSQALVQAVNPAATTTRLVSSPGNSAFGQAVILTATVSGASATGNVIFKDGATTLGTAALANGTATLSTGSLAVGVHPLTASYFGDANNAASTSDPLTQTVAPAVTSATLSSSANPADYGQAVTFTAAVVGVNPTGAVTFKDGADTLASVTLVQGAAAYTAPALSVGVHSITVGYGGDGNNAASASNALVQAVNVAPTTTALASSGSPSTFGQTVTLSATVAGAGPTGVVTFMDGSVTLGTAPLSNGAATLAVSALGVGSHSLTASYAGDGNNAVSTASVLTQAVNQAASTVALSASANPATVGQTVTFSASVTGANATGSVTFRDGPDTIATVPLAGGAASFSTSRLAVGSHSITASYSGDTGNAASTSTALAQVINAQATSSRLTGSINPAVVGQAVTFTATVQGSNPTGTVSFSDGATMIGTAPLAGGVASFTTSALAGGSHAITAAYSGDAINAPSTSAVLNQSVNAATITVVTANPALANAGATVTLTATVTAPGSGVPTGSVTFSEGPTSLGQVQLSGGTAGINVSTFTPGPHTITASYSGDATYPPSSGITTVTLSDRGPFSWQYGYDPLGRINSVIDPNNQASYFYYDSLGRRIQTQQPGSTVTSFGWDLQDSLTSVTDPRSLTTRYSPDGLGNVRGETSPDRGSLGYTYDAAGNVLTFTDARGKTARYTYDSLGRVTQITYATGAPTTFEYDGGANPTPNEAGELTRMTDESGSTTYTHDALGRLVSKTVTIAGKPFTVGYIWGDAGSALDKLTAITYPSGTQVGYNYDSAGMVSGIIVAPAGGSAQTLLSGIAYNQDNQPTGWLWGNGTPRSIGYDSVGMVASYSLGDPIGTGARAGTLRTLVRDSAGRITGYVHSNGQSQLDQGFSYDAMDRLTGQTTTSSSIAYTYDLNGNRTVKVLGGTSLTNTTASDSNRMTQVQDPTGTASIQYDAAGNVINDGTSTYSYSDRGRMGSATTPSGTLGFLYNGLQQRAMKASAAASAYYIYDEAGRLLGEYDLNGNAVYETAYLGSAPVAAVKGGVLYNVYADQIDTPRMITSQDNTIVWRWDAAEAFGATAPDQNPSGHGAFAFNQRFPGQVFDVETGLNQNWHREYNSRLGRYIQSDPIGLEGGINSFVYVLANPLQFDDSSGLILVPVNLPSLGRACLDDQFAPMVQKWIELTSANGLDLNFTEAFRTTAYQQSLSGNPNATTPAAAGSSLHEAGFAVDVRWRRYTPDQRNIIINAAQNAGLSWGGRFKKSDPVHFFYDPGSRARRIREAQAQAANGPCGCK